MFIKLTEEEQKERHRKKVKEWKKANPGLWAAQKKKYYRKTAFALKHKEPWEPEEDAVILKHWPTTAMTDTEMSVLLGRSVNAIQIRRCNLKSTTLLLKEV